MPATVSMYPPTAPRYNPDGLTVTVDLFLNSPPRVQRALDAMTLNRFIADELFAAGPQATGGAVVFDQLTSTGEFFTERDVEAIAPGAEFPIVSEGVAEPLVARVTKWGAAGIVTYEEIDRDRRDVLARLLVKIRNTIVRKVDSVALATLDRAPVQTMTASGAWNNAGTDVIGDLEAARVMIDEQDMGYTADLCIINPRTKLDLKRNPGIREALPRENMGANLLGGADLGQLLGFRWAISNRVPAGTIWVTSAKVVGSISDEVPLYSRVIDEPRNERRLIMAGRRVVPFITDPRAAVRITGA
jgi:hypothetical protein